MKKVSWNTTKLIKTRHRNMDILCAKFCRNKTVIYAEEKNGRNVTVICDWWAKGELCMFAFQIL